MNFFRLLALMIRRALQVWSDRAKTTATPCAPAIVRHTTPSSSALHLPNTSVGISAASHQPLRVLRVVESQHGARQVGRLRISGRMADVCAELDRLAAMEARCT